MHSARQAARGLHAATGLLCSNGLSRSARVNVWVKITKEDRFNNYLFTCLALKKDVINCDWKVKGLLIIMKFVILGFAGCHV